MKNGLLKKILPHFIAIVVFLIVSVLFAKPALEGKVLNQHDVVGWKGVSQGAFDYKEKHGHFPLWNTNVFSGMPNYMIAMEGKSIMPDLNKIISLGLPQPINFFFIACLCFYILCQALGVRNIIAVLGALAFAFATYNPIIIGAGHITKMYAIAYSPLFLAGLILTFEKKYWLGLAVTTLGAYSHIGANHPQISFYVFIVAFAIGLTYAIRWIRRKDWKHFGIALGITFLSVAAALTGSALAFLTSQEYAKATIRGGRSVSIQGDTVVVAKSEGLDTAYAFSYSLAKGEAVTLLMPNAYGGGTKNRYDEKSKVFEKLVARGAPEANAAQIADSLPKFWGDTGSTAGGPLYAGVIICLLALIGFVLYKHPLRWGLLTVSVLALFMAFGKNFLDLNLFLFEHVPFYNKFRAPSMTMVILQITIPIMAVLSLQYLLHRENSHAKLQQDFRKILYATGGLFVVLIGMYLMLDYRSAFDQQIIANRWDDSGTDEIGRLIVNAMREDRKSLFGMQILRTLAFTALVLGLLYMFMKRRINAFWVALILAAVTLIDQFAVGKNYLQDEQYGFKDEAETNFSKSAIDNQLLADTSHFRVYHEWPEKFSASDYKVSVFHKAVGGYHPAKLRIYQDIIEKYLMMGADPQVLNMLNAKYIIVQNPQNGQEMVIPNPEAYGPAWFVKYVSLVKDDAEELQGIGKTNLKDTALVQNSFAKDVIQPQWDSAATIQLTKFDNDTMVYNVDCTTRQFAVFSEVYYAAGWNAYIDEKKVNYVKANYVLRGLSVPAGKHVIKFIFEPAVYKKGVTISFIGSFVIIILVLGGFFMAWRTNKTRVSNARASGNG
jgi:hypothetical protein